MTRRPTSFRELPLALVALFAVVSLIALFAYAINAWQVFGFAKNVWRLPFVLCFGAAVVADALSLAGLFAAYVLRIAKWRVRAYAWFVFGLMTALSIAAAESFASWRQLPKAQQEAPEGFEAAKFAAGAVVVALALAVHLLIVCVRHAPTESTPAAKPTHPDFTSCPFCGGDAISRPVLAAHIARRHPAPAPAPAVRAPRPERVVAPTSVPVPAAPKKVRRGGRRSGISDASRENVIARVIAEEMTTTEAAREAGVSPRAVQQWVKAHNQQRSGDPIAAMRTLIEDSPLPSAQVNGRKPGSEVTA